MVEREEFEKIIKIGKSLYAIILDRVSKLDRHNTLIYSNAITDMCFNEIDFNKVYKTKEEAEWVAQMHTQRTEYFDPPIWEEFEKHGEPYYFIGKGGIKERIYIYNNNGRRKLLSSGCKFWGTPTKDNYIKACEYARNLFLGKENDNETDSDR